MAADYQLSFADILFVVRRRALLLAGSFLALSTLTLVMAVVLPPVYESTGIILVESQQIPKELVPSTITSFADERIQVIKQRVMTRENLYRIIEQYQLFKDESGSWTVTEMVEEMRSMIIIEPILANMDQRGKSSGTIAFKVSFEHRSPSVAHRVANEMVTLFLSENAKVRTERANETADFLTKEAEKLRVELEAVENKVAAFKQRHSDALPEHLNLRAGMLQRAEEELKSVTRDLKATQEERRFLDIELTAAKNGITPDAAVVSPALELERLKNEYRTLSARYQEVHPDLRTLREKIKAAEMAAAENASLPEAISTAEGLRVASVQAKIDSSNARMESLSFQQQTLQKRIHQIEGQIVQTPQNERELAGLLRDYENVKKKFEEVRAKEVDARMARSLEEESKAERFSLIEPPSIPEEPVKPNREKIAILGIVAALCGSGGLVLLLEMLNQRIWGSAQLAHVIRQPPIVVIPYIKTASELGRKKAAIKRTVVVAGIVMVVTLVGIHFLYMPIEVVWFKILARW